MKKYKGILTLTITALICSSLLYLVMKLIENG